MRTSKCLTSLLALALAGTVIVVAGQENTDTNSSVAETVSNTRTASCIVKIGADPAVINLSGETFVHLLYGSGVTGKAARDVLDISFSEALGPQDLLKIEAVRWNSGEGRSTGTASPETPRSSRYDDAEMMAEMRAIYGDDYVQQLIATDQRGARNGAKPTSSSTSAKTTSSSASRSRDRRSTSARAIYGSPYGEGTESYGMDDMGTSGYGDMMMGGVYGGPVATGARSHTPQTFTAKLSVHLPNEVKPAAQEFIAAVVANLRQSLWRAHDEYTSELDAMVEYAESLREDAAKRLEALAGISSPESVQVAEQLETMVDLSVLSPEMPLSEAVEILRHSVEPPLNIAVMWRELADNADILPNDPIDMDPLPAVKLKTALEVLLQAVSGGFAKLSHTIKNGVIVVATAEAVEARLPATRPTVDSDLRVLAAHRQALEHDVRNLELNLAGAEARREAIGEQFAKIRREAEEILDEDTVTRELAKLIQMNTKVVAQVEKMVANGRQSAGDLAEAQQGLTRAKIELARRQEELSKSAGGGQLDEYTRELSTIAIDMAETRARLDISRRQLDVVRRELAQHSAFDPQAARLRIARETLDLAERRVMKWTTRLADLEPPIVTMVGTN